MGHRASVGYVRENGDVDAHYSHWGALDARLAFGPRRITQSNPLGGKRMGHNGIDPDAVERFQEMVDDDGIIAHTKPTADLDVKPKRYGQYGSLAEWAAEGIDYLSHEAVYLVDTRTATWTVLAFDTVWLRHGDEPSEWDTGCGMLVRLEDADEWGTFTAMTDDWPLDGMGADEFEQRVRKKAGNGRVPGWSHAVPSG